MKKNQLNKAILWRLFKYFKKQIIFNNNSNYILFGLFLSIIMLFSIGMIAQTQIGADIDGEVDNDWSGYSVSMSTDGTRVAIGSHYNDDNGFRSGHVRVFQNTAGTWTQLGSDIVGEGQGDQSGYSVDMSADGTRVAIGAPIARDENGFLTGHVRVYQYNAGTWILVGQDIDGEVTEDRSGYSVSLNTDGSMVAIGATQNDGTGDRSGHVRVYQYSAGTWTQVGQDIDGEAAIDFSGHSVSINADGTTVAIGARSNSGNGSNSGHVRVYQNNAGTWTQIGADIDGERDGDQSGYSVSISAGGTIVAIGAPWNQGNGPSSGHVRVYQNNAGTWTQIGADIDGEAENDQSGWSISMSDDGTTVAIGAVFNDGNGDIAGHVRIYKNIAGTWTQVGEDINGEAINDRSGFSVSISNDGSTVAIGSPYNEGNGVNSGHVRVYDLSAVLRIGENELVHNAITIYPNPVKDKITIRNTSEATIQNITFYDLQGRRVKDLHGEFEKININSFANGLYLLKINTDMGFSIKKLLVSK